MEMTKSVEANTKAPSVFKQEKIYGLPFAKFAILGAIVLIAAYTGKLVTEYYGIIAYLMVVGGVFFYVGGKIPIFNDYMGGATVLPLFGASAMVLLGLVPEPIKKGVGNFMAGGFQNLYIAAILVGSILSLNRKSLLKSVYKYLPTIIGSQAFAILFLALAGILTGVGVFNAIFMIGAPMMSGGSAGAIATLPKMYTQILGSDQMKLAGPFLGYVSTANVISILSAAVLSKAFVNSKSFNGHGRLLMDEVSDDSLAEETRPSSDKDYAKLGAGLLISISFMAAGKFISFFVPQIADLAWTIIIAIIVKAAGLLSEEFCDYANYWFQFMLRNLLPTLIAGIGIASFNLTSLGQYFTIQALIVIIIGIAGAFIGAALFGRLFRLWPLEAGITAALCSCDSGGSGDIAILSASDRMQLIPFSSISTRIGGALMILEISLLMPFFVK